MSAQIVSKLYSVNRNGRQRFIGAYGRMSSATRVVDRIMEREFRRHKMSMIGTPHHNFQWEDGKLFMHYWFLTRFRHGKRQEIHRKFEIRDEPL